jgi:hypothetical protein
MKWHGISALALGMCFSSSTAFAQTPFGETFCNLYKQAAEHGQQAFVDLRGSPISENRWEVKDVSVPGGKCLIRAEVKKADLLSCNMARESVEEAKSWAADMTKASRECLNALEGFTEKSGNSGENDAKIDRTSWVKKTDGGVLNISVATIVRPDGKVQNRVQIRLGEKD